MSNTTIAPHAPQKDCRPIRPKPRRPKPERRIRVLEQPTADTDGWGCIAITEGKRTDTYLVRFITTDFGPGAIGFELEKLSPELDTVAVYHTLLDGENGTCDCPGGCYVGRCRHREGLAALRLAGKLLPVTGHRSAAAFARNDPAGYADHVAALTRDEYPDEPPELPAWADYRLGEDDGPDPAA